MRKVQLELLRRLAHCQLSLICTFFYANLTSAQSTTFYAEYKTGGFTLTIVPGLPHPAFGPTQGDAAAFLERERVVLEAITKEAIAKSDAATLEKMLNERRHQARLAAANALGEMRAVESIPALIRLVSSSHVDGDFVDTLSRKAVAEALKSMGHHAKPAIPALTNLLQDGRFLSARGNEVAVVAVKKALARITKDVILYEAAVSENLRKAQDAARNTDSTLEILERAAYVGYVLTSDSDLRKISKFAGELREPAVEVKEHTDRIVELAEKKQDREAAVREGKNLLDKVKLLKMNDQVEELDRLAKAVRELPVGLVSEKVDDKFVVGSELLINNPKEAEARFKAQLDAMKANVDFLTLKQAQLGEVGKAAKGAFKFLYELRENIEMVAPHTSIYGKSLIEFSREVDSLEKGYGGLASDCATKSKEAKRAGEVEQIRYDQLKDSLRTIFGFRL